MDIAHIRKHVRDIEAISHDPEAAHALEYDLRLAVLREIASTSTDERSRQLAHETIKAAETHFERWHA